MEKYYYELIIKPDSYFELFLDLVSSLTDDAIEELDEQIIVRSEDELDVIKEGVEEFAKELSVAFDSEIRCDITLEKKENQDWISIYQQSVQPVEIGTFYIHPSWYDGIEGKLNIIIDPTLAFGSGHHETTSSCVKAIEQYVKQDFTVCDVGSGSGILAIAAAKLGCVVDICDTDEVAVNDALNNFEMNNVQASHSWVGSANGTNKTYDVVIANIVADVLAMIAKDLKKITKQNGVLILSGIMAQHKQKVLNKFKDCTILDEIQQNEWVTLVLKVGHE
ncbi:MAG: 50S ribosomal protein L11 methyltransferase [Campylobacterales bacterium]|nr:50S ribosomal protein L11 methyltransferase [Campylobacterales bacterium]